MLSHGWVNLCPWVWDNKNTSLHRSESLTNKITVDITVEQIAANKIAISLQSNHPIKTSHENKIIGMVNRWLSLDWDPKPFIDISGKLSPPIKQFVINGGGRFLRGSFFYEDFVKTICTLNTTWAGTQRMVRSIVQNAGGWFFPTPKQMLSYGQKALEKSDRLGYRAEVMISATKELLDSGLMSNNGRTKGHVSYDKMIALRGIGPYAASHIMFLLHDYSKIPIDSEVSKFCKAKHGLDEFQIQDYYQAWGDFAFLGYKLDRVINKNNWIG